MVRTSLLITFLRYQRKLPSRVFLRSDRIEFHLKRGEREKTNESGDNSSPFGRLAEPWRKFFWKTIGIRKNGKRCCIGRNRARRAVQPWNENVLECPRGRSTGERGALKAQSGYNSGQGRKEIHSFFRFAPEITFRHLLEKKGEGWSLESFRFRVMIHSLLFIFISS